MVGVPIDSLIDSLFIIQKTEGSLRFESSFPEGFLHWIIDEL